MYRIFKCILVSLLASLFLCGCSGSTVDQMYRLPKRSEDFNNLQSAIEQAMAGLEYCAPLAGEHQQTVQMADLDADGFEEYLVFTKGDAEKPLKILIFQRQDESYVLSQTIESHGTAFDQVEYISMDDIGGVELVVGSQLSEQILRSVSVYSFRDGQMEQLMTTNYTKFLSCDLDENGLYEVMVIHPGQTDTDKGIAELYRMDKGQMERSNEVSMSEPADNLKRIVTGRLYGGKHAVYVASTVGENAIITDVFASIDGVFTNVTFSNESGTSVKTLRNYYVYAEDIDNDGVVELPALLPMRGVNDLESAQMQNLIRWYAMTPNGREVDKSYTYHNFVGGWYLELDEEFAPYLAFEQTGNAYTCYLWNRDFTQAQKVLSIYSFVGQNREAQSVAENRFEVYKNESVVYSAYLEPAAEEIGITPETLMADFHMIHREWKTGET